MRLFLCSTLLFLGCSATPTDAEKIVPSGPDAPLPPDLRTRTTGSDWERFLGPTGDSVSTEIEGFNPSASASDYDIRIENRKAGAGVRIRGDQPLSKVFFWSIRSVACPEPYIHLRVEPGQEARWTITYDLYDVR